MTDSSDPRSRKPSRKKPSREPATIDLKATVIDDGERQKSVHESVQEAVKESIQEDVRPVDETITPESELKEQEAVATPEATLDSGAGTDSIEPAASSQEPPVQEPPFQEPPAQDLPPREPPPVTIERRTSPAALLGSGLLGGLVGAGLVYGLQTMQAPQQGQDNQRLAQLEQRVGALGQPGAQPANLQAVEGRIRELEAARSSVDQRLQALQGTAEQAAARAEEALNRPLPAPAAPQDGAVQDGAALTDLSNRLSALEQRVPNAVQEATADLSNRLSALEGRVQAAAQEAAGAAQNATNAAQALERRLTDLEGRIGEQQQRAADRDRRLTEQDQRLSSLSQQVTEENRGAEAASQAGIRVILSERLGEALRSGRPYTDVLDGLRKAGADQPQLAALEPFAQQGAPTAAALAQSFEPLGAAILRDERSASGAWSDRLLRMMDQVVTVRPLNEPGSTGVPSLVARIEQALTRGDVVEAVASWEALPEPARRQSEEWGRQAKAVAEAHKASQAIASNALAALNQTAQ